MQATTPAERSALRFGPWEALQQRPILAAAIGALLIAFSVTAGVSAIADGVRPGKIRISR